MGLFAKATRRIVHGTTLYFPGCLAAAKLPHVVEAQKAALRDLGVPFVTLPMECCGYPAAWAGYEEEFKTIMDRNKRRLSEKNITAIVTGCPHCALIFKERYGIEAHHLLEVYHDHLEKIKHHRGAPASYHHPCFLDKLGVEEKVGVRVLRRAGIHIPPENKSGGCCGSVGDDFARNNPDDAKRVCLQRSKKLGEGTLVTACPYCIAMFRQQRKDVKDVAELLNE